jgi:hypothetical protein
MPWYGNSTPCARARAAEDLIRCICPPQLLACRYSWGRLATAVKFDPPAPLTQLLWRRTKALASAAAFDAQGISNMLWWVWCHTSVPLLGCRLWGLQTSPVRIASTARGPHDIDTRPARLTPACCPGAYLLTFLLTIPSAVLPLAGPLAS